MTKLAEIQEAIEQLPPLDRAALWDWFLAHGEETPEMLAFIDEGIKSAEEKGTIPLEEVRKKLPQWISGSA